MSILCGIDFSEPSRRAADVAAGIAAHLGLPLHLVHAMAEWPAGVYADEKAGFLTATQRALERESEKLRRDGIDVRLHIALEPPQASLIRLAAELGAELLVFGATGMGRVRGQAVGSTADRLAQQSQVPALVVRSPEPFEQWLDGKRPLRVAVGLDFDIASDHAWRWARELARIGPVELVGVHVYWPPHEFSRLGLSGRSFIGADPEVDRVLRGELEGRFHAGGPSARLRAEPAIGRTSDHLLGIALEEGADLVVVGSHRRSSVARLWEGSTSRGVLHDARGAVACVPLAASSTLDELPPVRTILAATDFSPVGNAAVAEAFALAGRGGKVYLVHVLDAAGPHPALEPHDIFTVSPAQASAQQAALAQLRALVPPRASQGEDGSEAMVLEARDTARAITQAAERLGADLLCIGTHGRSGVPRAVLGSVAQGVLAHTQRPTVVVRAPRA
jgi:nucleotide-binding universal stress UspA family protein